MPSLIRRFPFAEFFLPTALSARVVVPPAAGEPKAASSPAAPPTDSARLDALRGEAMRRLFPKLYMWWGSRREWGVALHGYAYLAEATTVEDLEQRIRHIERQQHFRS